MTRWAIALLGFVGCSTPDKPELYEYQIVLETVPGPAHLFAGDRKLGRSFAVNAVAYQEVAFDLALDERLSSIGPLTLRYLTPCGWGPRIALELELTDADETARRGDRPFPRPNGTMVTTVRVQARPEGEPVWPSKASFWVDGTARIRIGATEMPPGQNGDGAALFDLGCAASHEVLIDDQAVGHVSASDGAEFYFITTDPDACYRDTNVCYGPPGGSLSSSAPGLVAGAQVYPRQRAMGPYFLREAPGSVQGLQQCVAEFVRVPCP